MYEIGSKAHTDPDYEEKLHQFKSLEAEFNEFEQRLKSHKNRFQLCAGVKSCKMEYSLKWSQPYLSRGSNSLNSASGLF